MIIIERTQEYEQDWDREQRVNWILYIKSLHAISLAVVFNYFRRLIVSLSARYTFSFLYENNNKK